MNKNEKDYSRLRPLGARVLIQRYPLSRMSEGGIYVIGLDYPTLGKVLAVGPGWRKRNGDRRLLDIHVGDDVQWAVDSNFDLKQLSENIFLFNYDDLNLVGSEN